MAPPVFKSVVWDNSLTMDQVIHACHVYLTAEYVPTLLRVTSVILILVINTLRQILLVVTPVLCLVMVNIISTTMRTMSAWNVFNNTVLNVAMLLPVLNVCMDTISKLIVP